MTFDQPVKLISHSISYGRYAVGIATIYSQNLLQSIQASNSANALKLFSNQFIAQPDVPISVGSSDSSTSTIAQDQINAFTVEKVDVPRPLPLAGAAGCGVASVAPLAFESRARG
jgi:hypothetical protein